MVALGRTRRRGCGLGCGRGCGLGYGWRLGLQAAAPSRLQRRQLLEAGSSLVSCATERGEAAALARVQESDAGAAFAKALVQRLRERTAGGGAAGLTDLGYAQSLRLLCVAQRGSFTALCGTADKAAAGFEELAALQARRSCCL